MVKNEAQTPSHKKNKNKRKNLNQFLKLIKKNFAKGAEVDTNQF